MYQWLQFWLAESPWDVCVTNVTSGYGAVNLAGPRAREVLAKVTAINLDSAAFPYLGCAQGAVAEAIDPSSHRRLALKLLPIERFRHPPASVVTTPPALSGGWHC